MLQVYYTKWAYRISCGEAQKHFDIGISKEGRPHEAAMYPLSFVTLKPGVNKSPIELVSLDEILNVVVADIALVPDRYKAFSSHHCAFNAGDECEGEMNRVMNDSILDRISLHPCLDVIGKQHSHPFPGKAFLSAGDLNHSILNSSNMYRAAGFNTMFSHVMTRSSEGVWTVNNFALWRLGINKKLPEAIVIGDNHSLAREAKSLPYYLTDEGRGWCDSNKSLLKQEGFNPRRDVMRRGWRRYFLVHLGTPWLLITIPPFFPSQLVVVYKVSQSRKEMDTKKLSVPYPWNSSSEDLSAFSLSELAKHFQRSLMP